MADAPSGVLSLWAFIVNKGSGSPSISDFYATGGNFADLLVAPSDGVLFTEPSFAGRVTFNRITGITSASQATIAFDGDLGAVPAVGASLALWITNNVAPWFSAAARDLTIVGHTSNTIQVDWDTSTFAPYNPATYPNTFFDLAYVTGFTRAASAVVTTAIAHGLDGSSGDVWVRVAGLIQPAWNVIDNFIARVLSTTSNTITLEWDTSAIAEAWNPALNDVKIYVFNTVCPFFANSDQSKYFSPRTVVPLPIGVWTNILMSWDTNQISGAKRFSMYFGEVPVAPYYVADFLGAFSIPYSTPSTDVNVGWKAFGNGFLTDVSGFGYVAEYYWNAGAAFMDFSNSANRAKFHDLVSGHPVNLGSDGSGPTGGVPTVYMSLRTGSVSPPPALVWWEPDGLSLVQSPGVLGGVADSSQMVLSWWMDRNTSGFVFLNGRGITVEWDNEATPTVVTISLFDAAFNQFSFSFPYSGGTGVNVRVAVDTAHPIGAKVVHAFVGTSTAGVTVVQDDVDNLVVKWQDGATDFDVMNGVTGWLSEVWFGPGQFFDISGTEFVDGAGNPVNLGASGQNPSGVSPAVFVHLESGDPVSALNTNRGTGGNFTGGAAMLLQTGTRFLDNLAGTGSLRLATGPLLIAPTAP